MQSVPIPQSPDGYDGSPIVKMAVDALKLFSGDNLTRAAATDQLRGWVHFHELSDREVAAVLRRFPQPDATPAASGHAEADVTHRRWISPPDEDAPGVLQRGGGFISGSPTWAGPDHPHDGDDETLPCRHCGKPIRRDTERGIWTHTSTDTTTGAPHVTCGSGALGTSAAPRGER